VHAAVLAQQEEPLATDGLAIRAATTPELLLADLNGDPACAPAGSRSGGTVGPR
jgi:hypothetical protein